jgi:hypothetical protein
MHAACISWPEPVQFRGHLLWRQRPDRVAGRDAHRAQTRQVAAKLRRRGQEPERVARIDQDALPAVDEVFARSATIERDHRDPAGHGLQGDVAENGVQAGLYAQVGAGQESRQGVAPQEAGEGALGEFPLQAATHGTVAGHDHAGARTRSAEHPVCLQGQPYVPPRCKPSHVDQERGLGRRAQGRAQFGAALARVEMVGIDGSLQQARPREARGMERRPRHPGRDEGGVALFMEAAKPRQGRWEAGARVGTLESAIRPGVEIRGDRQAQAAGDVHGRPAQGSLGGDIDRIGARACPRLHQASSSQGRDAVPRPEGAGRMAARGSSLSRLDAGDAMAPLPQPTMEQLDGLARPAGGSRAGVGDDGVVHAGLLSGPIHARHRR